MPVRVPNVAWKCPICGKRKWLKPGVAKTRKACSRECGYVSQRVEHPVRAKQGQRLARYGERECPACARSFEAKYPAQVYCGQECATAHARRRRRVEQPEPRPCEVCGTVFTPRKGSAGRFCSRPCTYAGRKGEGTPTWKGGRTISSSGYVLLRAPEHPHAQKRYGYIPEHRVVMEQMIGRYLEDHETVHHINGDRTDNRPENLQLRAGKHGKGACFRCLDCGSTNVVAVKIAEA